MSYAVAVVIGIWAVVVLVVAKDRAFQGGAVGAGIGAALMMVACALGG